MPTTKNDYLEELESAFDWGTDHLNSGGEFPPTVVSFKDGKSRMVVVLPPFDNTTQKYEYFNLVGIVVGSLKMDGVIVFTDAYMSKRDRNSDPLKGPLPSEDPEAVEALIASVFGADPRVNLLQVSEYHHTPEGIIFDSIQRLDVDESPDSELLMGNISEIFNYSLQGEHPMVQSLSRAFKTISEMPEFADLTNEERLYHSCRAAGAFLQTKGEFEVSVRPAGA